MYLFEYIDGTKLTEHVRNGLVDVRHHRSLPLDIYTFSKRTVYDNAWDDVTTKCRGLIVGPDSKIVARPFEKFFNVDTSYRPETHMANLPAFPFPMVAEKLDGSLGIHYQYNGRHGIATKGSFHSEQAEWATRWYNRVCINPQWPEGYTPVFEIIAETVQHHVVHYYGNEELVLLALINNATGEEADYNTVYHYAYLNGVRAVDIYHKSLDSVVLEDRKNKEGYVLSWPRPGQPPLKVKVKHPGFLSLQKVVHAATPQAILDALISGDVDLLNTWIGQTDAPIGQWVKSWVTKFTWKYGEIIHKSNRAFQHAVMVAGRAPSDEARKFFAEHVIHNAPEYKTVCFAMLDGKDWQKQVWKIVEKLFAAELGKPFALETTWATQAP